jgi:error-prone DNA polymerase
VAGLRRLAAADAFGSMGLDRSAALWHVRPLRDERLPLFDGGVAEPCVRPSALPDVPRSAAVLHDYRATTLSLKAHPVSFLRSRIEALGAVPASEIADEARSPHGRRTSVAGVVLVRQRPATASGIVFLTIEDETGVANLIVRPAVYERFRAAAGAARLVHAEGTLERQGRVVHLLVRRIAALDAWIDDLAVVSRDFH